MKLLSLMIVVTLPAFAVTIRAADAKWHEAAEVGFSWCEIENSHLKMSGDVLIEGKKTPYSLEVDIAYLNEEDVRLLFSKSDVYYGLAGGGDTKGNRDSIINRISIKIGTRNLDLPAYALKGLLNFNMASGIKFNVTPQGYITLDLNGPEGERFYTCSFIFDNWQFKRRQVKYAMGTKIDSKP